MKINLGFSTGCLYRSKLHERKKLELLAAIGCKVVELGFVKLEDFLREQWAQFMVLTRTDFVPFDYVSLHAPAYGYGRDEPTRRIFNLIRSFHTKIRPLNLVVFHPDTVKDFFVFEGLDFPVAFENMDNRKKSHRDVLGLREVLGKVEGATVVLDVNHAFTNDPTCVLAFHFWHNLYAKIDQIHLSGYDELNGLSHAPLFKTRQIEIVRSIKNLNLPIIIESVLAPSELAKERDYILSVINGRQ